LGLAVTPTAAVVSEPLPSSPGPVRKGAATKATPTPDKKRRKIASDDESDEVAK